MFMNGRPQPEAVLLPVFDVTLQPRFGLLARDWIPVPSVTHDLGIAIDLGKGIRVGQFEHP
jgi:hypothetical protein